MNKKGTAAMTHIGIALLRIVVGVVFVAHGWRKLMTGIDQVSDSFAGLGIPAPLAAAVLVTFVELLGGAILLAGFLTRWVTIPLAITMTVAMFAVHFKNGFFLPQGYEYTLVLLAALIAIFLTGPGALSVDRVIQKRGRKDDQEETVEPEGPEPA